MRKTSGKSISWCGNNAEVCTLPDLRGRIIILSKKLGAARESEQEKGILIPPHSTTAGR